MGIDGDEPMGTSMTAETKFLWKALWRAMVQGKVKICVWRGCMDARSSKVNLERRRILTEDVYVFCDKEAETIEHALLHCSTSAAIWFASPLGLHISHRCEDGLGGWMAHMAQSLSKESFEFLLVLLWIIWKACNYFLWTGA